MDKWHGCYDDNWNGLIVDEAFAHPAKFANGLINRIFDHLALPKGSGDFTNLRLRGWFDTHLTPGGRCGRLPRAEFRKGEPCLQSNPATTKFLLSLNSAFTGFDRGHRLTI